MTLTKQSGYSSLSCNISENPNPSGLYIGNYIKLGENNQSCLKACDIYQEHYLFDFKLKYAIKEVFGY